jgi:hypothetical protein
LAEITGPLGRDVIQAIDFPIVEVGGGQHWGIIPWDTDVAGLVLDGASSVYPLLLLQKVCVVNDQIQERPLLVFLDYGAKTACVFDPMFSGRRLTMGLSGYFKNRKAVLYDRATESFWSQEGDALVAFAGQLKGSRLQQIGALDSSHWADWCARYPQSRLIVGGDRSKGLPRE